MSRHGLAITLAWYRLRSRVIADLSFEPIPKVLIRVYEIATVCYGPEILRWEIERPADRLEYYICCFSDRNRVYTFGKDRYEWNRADGFMLDRWGNIQTLVLSMDYHSYEEWSKNALGWVSR